MSNPQNGHPSVIDRKVTSRDTPMWAMQDPTSGMSVQVVLRDSPGGKRVIIQHSRNGILRGFEVEFTPKPAQDFAAALLHACAIAQGR